MQSFKDMLNMAGTDYDMLCDMFEYTWELFGQIKQVLESESRDEGILMDTFNKETESSFIICHFRASSYFSPKIQADQFAVHSVCLHGTSPGSIRALS